MLRDNLAGLIEPMFSSGGANPPALCTARKKSWTIDPHALKNRHTEGAESTLTENAPSPFHAEPRHTAVRSLNPLYKLKSYFVELKSIRDK
jgi:hypothetical protein